MKLDDDAERAAFLEKACAGDSELKQRVEALIGAYDQAGSFLKQPASEADATLNMPQVEKLGSQIGRYKLREVLGEGGMGTVFVAEQERPVRRKVALKLIKLGMDSRDVISRFEAERQALALMDHPNIARVLDAGVTQSGRPYFVMELVKGLPITEHCDLHKLGSRERLELFLQVCRALQHAHQKGIIHRDLKPSNVLVAMHDTIPVVKVIDFGVAKAIGQQLTEKTLYTAIGQMVGTPMYMSPEQAGQSSIDVDTRSDVYSLGVLLYELLTGCTPFEKETLKLAAYDEMRRIIQEVDPPRPSTRFSSLNATTSSTIAKCRQSEPHKLSQQLRGELDWIIMKSLEKERTRRYESASALAADVEHFLRDEPVEACPPSALYRFKKYARKRRLFLTAGFAVITAVLTGAAFSVWQAVEAIKARNLADERLVLSNELLASEKQARLDADKQRERANANLQQALGAVDQMLLRVADERLAAIPGAESVRQELFQDALKFYQSFFEHSSDDPHLRVSTAKAWLQFGNLYEFTGNLSKAQEVRQEAVRRWEALLEDTPDDFEVKKSLAAAYTKFSEAEHWRFGRFSAAEHTMLKALALDKELANRFPNDPTYQWEATRLEITLADNYKCTKRLELAEKTFLDAIGRQRELWKSKTHPVLPDSLLIFAVFLQETGHRDKNRDEQIESLTSESLARAEEIFAVDSEAALQVISGAQGLGRIYSNSGRAIEAENILRHAIAIGKQLPSYNPRDLFMNRALGRVHIDLANVIARDGRHSESLDLYYLASKFMRFSQLVVERHGEFDNAFNEATQGIGKSLDQLVRNGKIEEAEKFCEKLPEEQGTLSNFLLSHFLAIDSWEHVSNSGQSQRLTVSVFSELARAKISRIDTSEREMISRVIFYRAEKEFHRQHYDNAAQLLDHALLWNPSNLNAFNLRGEFRLACGDYAGAIADFDASLVSETANGFSTGLGFTACINRADANMHLANYSEVLADLNRAATFGPENADLLIVIDPAEISKCTDQAFKQAYVAWFQKQFLAAKPVEAALVFRARLFSRLGMVESAEVDLTALVADASVSPYSLYRSALASLELGSTTRYQEFCRLLIDRAKSVSTEDDYNWIAWTNALAPIALDDYAPAIAAARRGMLLDPYSKEPQRNLGSILFRSEQFDEAIIHLTSAINAVDASEVQTAYCSFFLAMTHHRLNHPDEAKQWFDKATESTKKWLDPSPSTTILSLPWNQKLTLELLQAEAASLLRSNTLEHNPTSPPNNPE